MAAAPGMRRALAASAAFHAAVVVGAYLTLPSLNRDDLLNDTVIVVEMVDIADITNAPAPVPEPAEKSEPEPPPPAPKPEPQATPEPVAQPEPEPEPAPTEPEPEVAALPPRPEPEPEPEIAPEPEPEPEPLPEPDAKPEPKPEPEPEPEPEVAKAIAEAKPERKPEPPKPPDPLASVLKTLEDLKQQAPVNEPEDEKPASDEPSFEDQIAEALKVTSTKKADPSKPISISTIEAVRERIRPCWNLQAGAKNAEELIIEIRVDMNPDATVGNAAIVDIDRAFSDQAFRAAAESALRAVKNPRCQPFPLPLDQYQQWRTMTLNFDPSGML